MAGDVDGWLPWRPRTTARAPFDRIKPTLGKAEASRTPLAFRDELLAMARSARRVERPEPLEVE